NSFSKERSLCFEESFFLLSLGRGCRFATRRRRILRCAWKSTPATHLAPSFMPASRCPRGLELSRSYTSNGFLAITVHPVRLPTLPDYALRQLASGLPGNATRSICTPFM